MNSFDLLGYRNDRPYSLSSKTNLGYYALIVSGGAGSYSLSANAGSYTIAGQIATFTKTPLNVLTADSGSYTISGQDATFTYVSNTVVTAQETLIKIRSFTISRRI